MPKLIEFVFNEHCYYNAITEANTYFFINEAGIEIKIKVINNEVYSTKSITATDKEIIMKMHYASNC